MRIILLLMSLWAAGQVSAQSVYRCVGKGGAIAFTSQPSNPLERTTKVVHAYVKDDLAAARHRQQIESQMDRRNGVRQSGVYSSVQNLTNYNGVQVNDTRAVRRAQCAQAKQHLGDTLERVGLRRSFDLIRRLDDHVRDNCTGL